MKPILAAAVAAASFAIVASASATPTWTGDTLGLTFYYPGTTVLQSQRTLSVGDSLSNVGYTGNYNGFTGATLSLETSQIIVDLSSADNASLRWDPTASFDGWVLTDLTNDPLITDVSIASETDFALAQSAISFTSNSVTVNWAGVQFGEASQLVLNVTFDPPADPVPEPASLVIFATALGGVGFIRHKFNKGA